MIGVVDYAAGNAPSVLYALERLGLPARAVARPEELAEVDRIILPGVGAAAATMDSLGAAGLVEPLGERVLEEGVPFLGICVGLQILFERSEEGDTECLGWLPGTVRRFAGEGLRVPQMGWNEVRTERAHPFLDGLPAEDFFYFVNSYYAEPDDPEVVLGTTDYGGRFAAVVGRDAIVATQFHAEKSGEAGLRLLSSFAALEPVAAC